MNLGNLPAVITILADPEPTDDCLCSWPKLIVDYLEMTNAEAAVFLTNAVHLYLPFAPRQLYGLRLLESLSRALRELAIASQDEKTDYATRK